MVAFMNTLSSVLLATLLSVVLFATQGGALLQSSYYTRTSLGTDFRPFHLVIVMP
ncbi:hypothetical protein K435DRAFT_785156 [Dendrothele bispora CBS 962.96]|uniref:Uncharacterized protein n=1 Tax=Dendrothele bispora (strain CBS 962.96) TaxID=1314807 RepID=A0A4S8KZL8_DENBC|nr:hypothetical protein K435DRAFT_785156 [Dendrothele bispora CBS 962.96]